MSNRASNTEWFAAFQAASRCLEQAGIRHWIDFGTLLGAVREGGYIDCDQDVDFNFFCEDLPDLLSFREHFAREFRLELIYDRAVNTVRLLPRHPELRLTTDQEANRSCIDALVPYADFYPCWPDGKWLRHPIAEYDFRSIYCRRLERIPFEGGSLPSPQNPLSLLLHRYGPDWPSPMGRFEFDAQARDLIWPFPQQLGCLLIVSDGTALNRLVATISHLRLDFDRVVALLPPHLFDVAPRDCCLSHLELSLDSNPVGVITASLLDSLDCHFVLPLGSPALRSRLAPELLEADVVLADCMVPETVRPNTDQGIEPDSSGSSTQLQSREING